VAALLIILLCSGCAYLNPTDHRSVATPGEQPGAWEDTGR
jgi:hypothetical protein